MTTVPFYYYTDEAGLQEIKLFGYITTSPLIGVDSVYGQGVYVTQLPPSQGQDVVTLNNWGSYWNRGQGEPRGIDHCIQLSIPADNLVLAASNPSVFICLESIELDRYQWKVWVMNEVPPAMAVQHQVQDMYVEVETDTSDDSDSDCR